MIRTATAYDIPALKKIWDGSFDDPINYIDFIFDKLAAPSDAVIYEENGIIVSMLLLIKTKFVFGDESTDAVYIMGAATSAQYQNRGFMTYLLEHAENLARTNGAQLSLLVPGEQYLYNYYRKRGYSADFRVRAIKLEPGMLEDAPAAKSQIVVDRASPSFIYTIREESLNDQPHVQWSIDKIKTIMEDSFIYGDHVASYPGEVDKAYAFYSVEGRKLFIKECLGTNDGAALTLIKELIKVNRAKSVNITLPPRAEMFKHEGELIPYGMAKPLNVKSHLRDLEPYMNLMFD